jgi:hypothetical protein
MGVSVARVSEHYDDILQVRHQTNQVFRDRWYRLDGPDSPGQSGELYSDLALKMVMNTAPAERVVPLSADRRNGRSAGRTRTTGDT